VQSTSSSLPTMMLSERLRGGSSHAARSAGTGFAENTRDEGQAAVKSPARSAFPSGRPPPGSSVPGGAAVQQTVSGTSGEARAAEVRHRLRERNLEVQKARAQLEWLNAEGARLEVQSHERRKLAMSKVIQYWVNQPVIEAFKAWHRVVWQTNLVSNIHCGPNNTLKLADRKVGVAQKALHTAGWSGVHVSRCFDSWRVGCQVASLEAEIQGAEQTNGQLFLLLEQLRAQTFQMEAESHHDGEQVQALAAQVLSQARSADKACQDANSPIVSREELAMRRAEVSVRLRLLKQDLKQAEDAVQIFWARAHPYLVRRQDGTEEIDPDPMILALARAVLPLAHLQDAERALQDLRHATGADNVELADQGNYSLREGSKETGFLGSSAVAVPAQRPPLLPGSYRFEPDPDQGKAMRGVNAQIPSVHGPWNGDYRPATQNAPMLTKAFSASVDLNRLVGAAALLRLEEVEPGATRPSGHCAKQM